MRKILGLSLLFLQLASHLLGQSIFYTHFKYELTWENNVWQSWVDTKFKGVPGNGYSCQVKWDPHQLKMTGYNPIIAFLYQRIEDRKLRALTALNGPELSPEELIDLAYWRKSIHACTGDWIASYEPDEIKYLKLHQQWYVDATGHTLKNKVVGLTPIRVDEEQHEVEMFYLPMENEMSQNVLNQQSAVYIRAYSTIYWPLSKAPKTYFSISFTPIGKNVRWNHNEMILFIRQKIKPSLPVR